MGFLGAAKFQNNQKKNPYGGLWKGETGSPLSSIARSGHSDYRKIHKKVKKYNFLVKIL